MSRRNATRNIQTARSVTFWLAPLMIALAPSLQSCQTSSSHHSSLANAGSDSPHPITELNSSVIAVGDSDWQSERCVQMVDRASKYKQSKIMFVPTLFWVQTGDGPIDHYCYDRHQDSSGRFQCDAADDHKILAFKNAMQRCFKRAIDAGLSIAVTPHLDDGTGQGRWRNILNFDPLDKRSGYSYVDAVIYPIADALNAVAADQTDIYFGMQGEMSATVFRHPSSWRSLIATIKDRVGKDRSTLFKGHIQVGVSTNFNKLCGCVGLDIVDPQEFVSQYPVLWQKVQGEFDLNEVAALFDAVDYVGMSSYPSLFPNFPTSEIENAMSQFDFEFGFFGLSLQGLMQHGKKIHLSEYGVGGGSSQNGNVKASSAVDAAKFPFFGVFGAYSSGSDPWNPSDQSGSREVRDYRRYFYTKTLEYLRHERAYKYRVDAAFLWDQSSWDIQGIYPESSTSQGSFRDQALVDLINQHNSDAMSGVVPKPECTDVPPDATSSCSQQAGWNKCSEGFMQNYCDKSCGRCGR